MSFLNPYLPFIKIAGGIALVLSLWWAWSHYVKTPYINQGKAEIQPKLDSANKSIEYLTDKVNNQNIAVLKLQEDSLKRTLEAQEALKHAQAISLSKQSKIMALTAQIGQIKTCNEAAEYAKGKL